MGVFQLHFVLAKSNENAIEQKIFDTKTPVPTLPCNLQELFDSSLEELKI